MKIAIAAAETADQGIQKDFQRVCIDLRDLTGKGKDCWHDVPPPYRMWVWDDDIDQDRGNLGVAGTHKYVIVRHGIGSLCNVLMMSIHHHQNVK